MAKRLLLLARVSADEVAYSHRIGSEYVTPSEFSKALRQASLAGRLTFVSTQSTGFGWRSVWEIAKGAK